MITWCGKKIADAGFVINIADSADRLKLSFKALSDACIEGVERFNAIVIPENNGGCTQSHIEIAKLQIKNNWDYVLYLEDDIMMDLFYHPSHRGSINLEKVVFEVTKDLHKFEPDILWLGTRPEKAVEKITDTLFKPTKTVMSHAYLGSLKYANFLVENLTWTDSNSAAGGWPIDFFISELNNKQDWRLFHEPFSGRERILNNDLKVYMMLPNIFIQGPSISEIENRYVDHRTHIKGCFEENINLKELNIKKFLYNE